MVFVFGRARGRYAANTVALTARQKSEPNETNFGCLANWLINLHFSFIFHFGPAERENKRKKLLVDLTNFSFRFSSARFYFFFRIIFWLNLLFLSMISFSLPFFFASSFLIQPFLEEIFAHTIDMPGVEGEGALGDIK